MDFLHKSAVLGADFYLNIFCYEFVGDGSGGEVRAKYLVVGIEREFGKGTHTGAAYSGNVDIHDMIVS